MGTVMSLLVHWCDKNLTFFFNYYKNRRVITFPYHLYDPEIEQKICTQTTLLLSGFPIIEMLLLRCCLTNKKAKQKFVFASNICLFFLLKMIILSLKHMLRCNKGVWRIEKDSPVNLPVVCGYVLEHFLALGCSRTFFHSRFVRHKN